LPKQWQNSGDNTIKVNRVIELDNGHIEVNANFGPEETSIIVEVGLAAMLKAGALPFRAVTEEDLARVAPNTLGSKN